MQGGLPLAIAIGLQNATEGLGTAVSLMGEAVLCERPDALDAVDVVVSVGGLTPERAPMFAGRASLRASIT